MTSSAKQCRAGVQERGNTYPVKPVGRRRFRWAAIKCVIVAQGNLKHLPRTDSVVVGMKYIASVSFGKDSLAMLLRLIAENYPLDAVVFYDTGMEFQAIYDNRDKAAVLLQNQGITFVELHPSKPFLWVCWSGQSTPETAAQKQAEAGAVDCAAGAPRKNGSIKPILQNIRRGNHCGICRNRR